MSSLSRGSLGVTNSYGTKVRPPSETSRSGFYVRFAKYFALKFYSSNDRTFCWKS